MLYHYSTKSTRFIKKDYEKLVLDASEGKLTIEQVNKFDNKKKLKKSEITKYDHILCSTNQQVTKYNKTYYKKFKGDSVNDIIIPTNKDILEYNKRHFKNKKEYKSAEELNNLKINMNILIYENINRFDKIRNGKSFTLISVVRNLKSKSSNNKKFTLELLDLKDEEKIKIDLTKLEVLHISPSFAMTIHKAQGVTYMKEKIIILMEKLGRQKSAFFTSVSRVRLIEQITLYGTIPSLKVLNNVHTSWTTLIKNNIIEKAVLNEFEKTNGCNIGGYEIFKDKKTKENINTLTVDLETDNMLSENCIIKEWSCYAITKSLRYKLKDDKGTDRSSSSGSRTESYTSAERRKKRIISKTESFMSETISKDYYTVSNLLEYIFSSINDGIFTVDDPLYIQSFNGSGFDYQAIYRDLRSYKLICGDELNTLNSTYYINKTDNNGSIKYLSINDESERPVVIFHDVFLMVTCSLANACETYIPEKLLSKFHKTYFPHELLNNVKGRDITIKKCIRKFQNATDEERKIYEDNNFEGLEVSTENILTKSDRDRIPEKKLKLLDKFIKENKKFNPLRLNKKYVKNDVEVTEMLYKYIDIDFIRKPLITVINTVFNDKIIKKPRLKIELERIENLRAVQFATITSYSKYITRKYMTFDKDLVVEKSGRRGYEKFVLRLSKLNLKHYEFAKQCIFGGRSIIRQMIKKCIRCCDLHEKALLENDKEKAEELYNKMGCQYCSICADIKGMYNGCMIKFNYPYDICHDLNDKQLFDIQDKCEILQDLFDEDPEAVYNLVEDPNDTEESILYFNSEAYNLKDKQIKHFAISCDLSPNTNDIEPSVPYKLLLKEDKDGNQQLGKTRWDVIARTQKLSEVDLFIAIADGWKVSNITEGNYHSKSKKILMNINLLFSIIKQQGQDSGNEALRSIGKLLSNSLYGSILSKNYNEVVYHIYKQSDADSYLSNPDFIWSENFKSKDGSWLMKGKLEEYNNTFLSDQNIFMGVYVLSYSRMLLNKALRLLIPNKVNGNSTELYEGLSGGDTDSIVFCHKLITDDNIHLFRPVTGYFTDELADKYGWKDNKYFMSYIYDIVAPCAKVYSYLYVVKFQSDVDVKLHEKLMDKGFTKRSNRVYENEKHKCKGMSENMLTYFCNKENTTIHKMLEKVVLGDFKPEFTKFDSITKAGMRLSKEQIKKGFKLFEMYSMTSKTRRLGISKYTARKFDYSWKDDGNLRVYGDSLPNGYKKVTLQSDVSDGEDSDDEQANFNIMDEI